MSKYDSAVKALISKGDNRSYNEIAADIEITIWKQRQVAKIEQKKKQLEAHKASKRKTVNKQQLVDENGDPITDTGTLSVDTSAEAKILQDQELNVPSQVPDVIGGDATSSDLA